MEKRGLKETEIGSIPEDWEVKRIGDSIELVYGKGLPKRDRKKGEIPVFGSNGIIDYNNQFIVDGPGIIIGRKGSVGEVKLSKDNFWPIDTTYYVKLKDKNDLLFWYYLLKVLNLNQMDTHSAVPGLNRNDVYEIIIAIPPLYEQKNIAKILSSLDNKIELNHKMNQTLEKIGQAIFKHWFIDFEFPDEDGKLYKSSGGEMLDSELGEIPKGWKIAEIGKVIETTGGGTPSTKKEEYWEDGDIQWFSPRDITANKQMFISKSEKQINDLGLKKSSANLFPPYSLMMTSRATVGEVSINTKEACTNQGFITCIPNNKLSVYYLYFWIKRNKDEIISLAGGSTFREINKSTFRALKTIIPNKNILNKYNNSLKPIFKQVENLQAQNENLSQIRDSLLPKLMSGKIRLNKLINSNQELSKRIRGMK